MDFIAYSYWSAFWLSVVKPKRIESSHNGQTEERRMSTESKTYQLPKSWENTSDQVMIGFTFVSDWLRKCWKVSGPITEGKKKAIEDYLQHSIENCSFCLTRINWTIAAIVFMTLRWNFSLPLKESFWQSQECS